MKTSVRHSNPDRLKHIIKRAEEAGEGHVVVGYPSGDGHIEAPHYTRQRSDGSTDSGMSIKGLAIVHNEGAKINHPGGTPYYTKPDGMKQFVRLNSPAAADLPKTQPHTITIPARRFMEAAQPGIRKAVEGSHREYQKTVIHGNSISVRQHLEYVGQLGRDCVVEAIDALDSPANKASTIKRKGSSHPLIDNGDMKNGATFQYRENE